jgi:hypothetical protein
VQKSITGLLGSMDIAFGATIVSGVLGIWAEILATMVKTAATCMLADDGEASLKKRIDEFDFDAMIEGVTP